MWLYLGAFSAVFLGLYDVTRKYALRENAVVPVVFLATAFEALLLAPLIILSRLAPDSVSVFGLYVPHVNWAGHILLFIKAILVGALWLLGYFSMKHLPLSIFSPIAASSPAWTLFGAMLLFGERLTGHQWIGFAVLFVSYYIFSIVGSREGIVFHTNKWVLFLFAAVLLGSASALYDKYLVKVLGLPALAVQVWFCIYTVPLFGITLAIWLAGRARYTPFKWRWTILPIGLWLAIADVVYFKALGCTGAMISLLAAVRSAGAVVSFSAGATVFGETRILPKSIALAGVLAGVILLLLSQ